ncbi:MAG: hypothetical protein LQ346_008105, partial [Caloplaca aetnensis]
MDLDEGASTPCLVDYDEAYYDSCLKEDFPRLFKNKCNSEIELLYNTDQTPECTIVSTKEDKLAVQQSAVSVEHDVRYLAVLDPQQDIRRQGYQVFAFLGAYSIIRQENTFGRLLVTFDTFRSLLSRYRIICPYINYLRAFGSRDADEERSRSAYFWHKAQHSSLDEFCYNVKHVARNGRSGVRNPWSFRQIGVYEKLNVDTGQSVWILIRPSDRVHDRVKAGIEARPQQKPLSPTADSAWLSSMALHADILVASGREWGVYLEGLRSQVQELDKQAIYTTVGETGLLQFDFSLTFEDRQKIQQYRSRLSVALHALDTDIDIVQGCKARYCHLAKHSDSSTQATRPVTDAQHLQDQFDWHLAELKAHRHAARSIIEHCSWTANLVRKNSITNLPVAFAPHPLRHHLARRPHQEKILEYRNDETMQTHSQALRDLAAAQKTEAENMTRLTRQTAQDSKMLKALTVMATLYLPATLLA